MGTHRRARTHTHTHTHTHTISPHFLFDQHTQKTMYWCSVTAAQLFAKEHAYIHTCITHSVVTWKFDLKFIRLTLYNKGSWKSTRNISLLSYQYVLGIWTPVLLLIELPYFNFTWTYLILFFFRFFFFFCFFLFCLILHFFVTKSFRMAIRLVWLLLAQWDLD